MSEVANVWIWLGFTFFVIAALSIDTFFLKDRLHPNRSLKIALYWTLVWIASALIFNALLWFYLYEKSGLAVANQKSVYFFTGYLLEKSLSVDNLFAFYMIFTQLHIPVKYQHRVFSYGIWSAIIMRLLVILLLTWVVLHFHWMLYVMGIFLLLTGVHLLLTAHHDKQNIAESPILLWLKRHIRLTGLHGQQFFIRKNRLIYLTPLMIALIFIEISDLIFALDSIPAIFAITTDPFIVWSSNIFAILGLRAMYFLLVGMVNRLWLLKYGLALILVYIGLKMVIAPLIAIPVLVSLAVIATILVSFTLLSLTLTER